MIERSRTVIDTMIQAIDEMISLLTIGRIGGVLNIDHATPPRIYLLYLAELERRP